MSTSKTYQQSLADAGSETRPPMLERELHTLGENITPTGSTIPRLQEVKDLQGDDLLYYDAEMELMNMILLSIPNEIYNSVDSCKTAKEMWARVERLMRGTIQNQVDRETRFTNEFDQFVAEPGESLVSVYNRFAQLMNDLERNNMKFPTVSKLVNASRAKKLEKSHDPLALVAHTGSSSKNISSYYVTHPSSVVDYDEEYEQDDVHTILKIPYICYQYFNRFKLNCSGKGHYARMSPRQGCRDRKMEEIEELSVNICLMARIQPAFKNSDDSQAMRLHFYEIEMYKERNRVLENITKDNNYLKEFLEADERAKRVQKQAESQLYRDRDIIRDLKKQRDKLSQETSPTKQTGANQNTHVIRPGMYRVVTTQESQTNKTKSALSSTGMNATSRVRRPMSKDSHVTHSVLDNSKKATKNVAVYVRKNKHTDNTFANVIPNKENVIDVDVANASKAKTLLCVSCMKNVLIPCHDKCVAKHKLNVRSNVRRTFSTNSRPPKSSETTFVAPKTRFSEKKTQSKTLDTTFVVSKSKIDVESASKAKDKVSSASRIKQRKLRDKPLNTFIKNKIRTSRVWQKWFESQPNVIWTPISIKLNVHNTRSSEKPSVSVKKWVVKLPSCPCVVSSCVIGDDLLTGGRDSNLYNIFISDIAASSPVCLMSKATSTKSWLWHRRLSHLNFATINDLTCNAPTLKGRSITNMV
ncbi:retrovirus-related pol polyprotein from transposon TNT 1-94 [Tanacetum coccineum]